MPYGCAGNAYGIPVLHTGNFTKPYAIPAAQYGNRRKPYGIAGAAYAFPANAYCILRMQYRRILQPTP
jgi:hypothetical protein